MNDREYRQQKRRIRRLIRRWENALGLRWWRISHVYYREGLQEASKEGASTLAQCTAQWEYRLATVRWSMPDVKEVADDELDEAFVHEMMHVFVSEMREGADHDIQGVHEEAVCTLLARAFVWTWNAGAAAR